MTPAMGALELIALALWSFAVSAAGGLVGLVLGNLRLPLVVLLASSPAAGAGANVAISGWRQRPRRPLTHAPGASAGGCSPGWRRPHLLEPSPAA